MFFELYQKSNNCISTDIGGIAEGESPLSVVSDYACRVCGLLTARQCSAILLYKCDYVYKGAIKKQSCADKKLKGL